MTDTNFNYLSLTPEIQLDALASIGIYPESGLIALNSYENRVSLFTDENKIRYVVKFYRPQRWSEAQLLEDHQFSLELHKQGCPIAAPVQINARSLFQFNGYYFALFPSLSARSMQLDNIDQFYDIGIALGKIHSIAAQKTFQHREPLDVETMLYRPIQALQKSQLIPKHIHTPLFAAMQTIKQQVNEQLKYSKSKIIRLHGDCHASNILVDDGSPYFVDFDDCKMGPAIQDMWMLLSGSRQEKQLQLATLVEGYEEEYEFDRQELTLIEPLRSMRIINYVNWINKRWTDPAFPVNFPWFTTDQYWKELLQSLQQQIIANKEASLSLQPSY